MIQAVVEDDPQYVVRRLESGRYAVDSESRRIYQRALELVEVCVCATCPSVIRTFISCMYVHVTDYDTTNPSHTCI